MDQFSRTLLPAAAEAGIDNLTVSRHTPLFRRSAGRDDTVLFVAPCLRTDRPQCGDLLVMLTRRRLVVTKQTWVFGRIRRILDAALDDVAEPVWTPHPSRPLVDLDFRLHGTRYRLRIKAAYPDQVWRIGAAFTDALRIPVLA